MAAQPSDQDGGRAAPAALAAGETAELAVEVVRSARRRKTVEARLVDGRMQLLIPARMSAAEEQRWIVTMGQRLGRQLAADADDLDGRARLLARRYRLPTPTSVRWVDNQRHRWGSCTPTDGTIRLSTRMRAFPRWVVDGVLVHELAHLAEPGHGPAFRALVERYPRTERATGFLIAQSMLVDEPWDDDRWDDDPGAEDPGGTGP